MNNYFIVLKQKVPAAKLYQDFFYFAILVWLNVEKVISDKDTRNQIRKNYV
jgi:hypothetical protein